MRQGVSLTGPDSFRARHHSAAQYGSGVYAIETVVFDRQRIQLIANGPWLNVTVQEGKSFVGEVQMNPEMILRSPRTIG